MGSHARVRPRRQMKWIGALVLLLLVPARAVLPARNQELLQGQVLPSILVTGSTSQTYALYLPKDYSPDRPWPLLMGFHFEGRGVAIVAKYRAAAEAYGYIVAASNNSQNGDWSAAAKAAQAMADDLARRFAIDPARVYTTGLSGGARLAMHIAMTSRKIAGVIASSAGYPDVQARSSLPFPVYATVGTLDFNYIEMRRFDQALKTPHRMAVFAGGHELPSDDVAMRAIEWMELQAMASDLQARRDEFIMYLWQRRQANIEALGESVEGLRELRAAAEDFRRLGDVSDLEARATALAKRPDMRAAVERARRDDLAEGELVDAIVSYEIGLLDGNTRAESLTALRSIVSDLRRTAGATIASPERDSARRVLDALTYAAAERVGDLDYLNLLLNVPQKR